MIIISGYDDKYKDIGLLSEELIGSYCKIYSFKSKIYYNVMTERKYSWNKIKFLLDSFNYIENNEYSMWIDADAFILNNNINIEGVLKNSDKNIIISKSHPDNKRHLINCGVFAIKKNNYTENLLE